MYYILLLIAIAMEISATTLLGYSDGFTKIGPSVGSIVLYGFCCFFFAKALLGIDLGIAYATWSSVGIIAASIIAAAVFGQRLTATGIIGIALIIVGCILVNMYGAAR